jgi:hypothetical protein
MLDYVVARGVDLIPRGSIEQPMVGWAKISRPYNVAQSESKYGAYILFRIVGLGQH